ncbi:MAG: endonuclease domain-containing protein [Candidatus Aminicenantes bacterium]|nr:endonuclease domain-containing protein [Candidatus Aminicenantes bacterium]
MTDLKESEKKGALPSDSYQNRYDLSHHTKVESESDKIVQSEYWEIPIHLRKKMVKVARDFRKNPTGSEQLLWKVLRNRSFNGNKFRRQQPIGPFVVDFFCPEARLIVEIDGEIHLTHAEADKKREELLKSLGFHFIRIKAEEVENDLFSALSRISHFFD